MDGYPTDFHADLAHLLPAVTVQDVVQFHQQHIAADKNRVWLIIGDKKLTDLKALARFGKVVVLKKEDIYR